MQQYMAQHGTSYYVANRFFPEQVKQDVFTLYAFVRIPDDIVDEPGVDPVKARKELDRLRDYFQDCFDGKSPVPSDDLERNQVASEAAKLFHTYQIPLDRVRDFFAAMYADLEKKVYYTYEELQKYMYGSAEVVGLMMCKIIGYDEAQEAEVFRTAKLLGEAMQYTNFLRDIQEDAIDFDRMYIPEDRLQKHHLNHVLLSQYVAKKPVDDTREKFMSQQVLFCKELYREANEWIALLDPRGTKAVRVASRMYESILDKIIRNEYDVFSMSARTTKREKIRTLLVKTLRYARWEIA